MTSYVGFDVSLAETSVCVFCGDGRVRFGGKVKTRPEDLVRCLRKYADDLAGTRAPPTSERTLRPAK